MIFLGIHYIIGKDVLRKIARRDKWKINLSKFLKNWPDKAFNIFGVIAIIAGILIILNSEFLLYAVPIVFAVLLYQRYYYNKKAKEQGKKKDKK